jgi:hypothetical protein
MEGKVLAEMILKLEEVLTPMGFSIEGFEARENKQISLSGQVGEGNGEMKIAITLKGKSA